MGKINRGMILAAGLGTRLLPITKNIPKPLIHVLNVPNILYNVFLLREAGIKDIIINLHHLQQLVEDQLDIGNLWGVNLEYSKEIDLMGTGGGIKKAEAFFNKESFVVCNCDLITDIKLSQHIETHQKRNALATMILYKDPAIQDRYSKVGVNKKGELCSLPLYESEEPVDGGIYTGVQILSNEALAYLEDKPSSVTETLYRQGLEKEPKRMFGDIAKDSVWYDTGDYVAIWSTSMTLMSCLRQEGHLIRKLLEGYLKYEEKRAGIWIPKGESIPKGTELQAPVIIGKEVEFRQGSKVGPNVIIGDNSKLGTDSKVDNSIILPGTDVSHSLQASDAVLFGKGEQRNPQGKS